MPAAVSARVGPIADIPARPPSNRIGARYFATDEDIDYEWNGVVWVPFNDAPASNADRLDDHEARIVVLETP